MATLARKRAPLAGPEANDLARALASCWSEETSSDRARWSPDNRAWGQCAVSALVVQDYLGGELLRGQMVDGSHYWNVLPGGEQFDATRGQFETQPVFSDISLRSRGAVLSHPDTKHRYEILSEAVRTALASKSRA